MIIPNTSHLESFNENEKPNKEKKPLVEFNTNKTKVFVVRSMEEYIEDMGRYDVAAAALCKDLTPQFLNSRGSS